jgi:hypothetical protein
LIVGELGNVPDDDAPQFALVTGAEVVVVEVDVTDELAEDSAHAAA